MGRQPRQNGYHDDVQDLVREMGRWPSLSAAGRRDVERMGEMAWAEDLVALTRLWETCPALVERYLDLIVCVLHEFPDGQRCLDAAAAAAAPAAASVGKPRNAVKVVAVPPLRAARRRSPKPRRADVPKVGA